MCYSLSEAGGKSSVLLPEVRPGRHPPTGPAHLEANVRRLTLLLLTLLLAGCARGAPTGPTPAPGQATWTPTAVGTFQARQRPTATPTLPPATPTLRPTAPQPTEGIWTRAEMPAERVCLIAERRSIDDAYTEALVRFGVLVFRLESNPTWLADKDFLSEAKGVAREIRGLPELPCTVYAKSVLVSGSADLLEAFGLYATNPDSALRALINARSADTTASLWWTGSRWWTTISVPLG
jgi:hypothetical protein